MNQLTIELKSVLYKAGAKLVGCADLSHIADSAYEYGVSVAVPIPPVIVRGIMDGPTAAYFDSYHEIERRLDDIVTEGEAFLLRQGYPAYAQTSRRVEEDAAWRTPMPHKTVATNAGMGWIGKNCLLVTQEYGSAVRLSSILTNAPVDCNQPIRQSNCKGCGRCVDMCPAHALSGKLWDIDVDRDAILNKEACRDKQIELTAQNTSYKKEFLCGRCFAVCPFTQRYINRS